MNAEHHVTIDGAAPWSGGSSSSSSSSMRTRSGLSQERPAVPVSAAERLDVLDALRGFAICGILLINIEVFSGRLFLPPDMPALAGGNYDSTVMLGLTTLVYGKLFPLLSCLFGVGFGVFIERAAARGVPSPVALFRRRLFGLLGIGLTHAVLIWYGDILTLYALLGFLLVLFVHRTDRTVLRWSLAILPLPVLVVGARFLMTQWGAPPEAGATEPGAFPMPPFMKTAIEAFRSGAYWDIVAANATLTGVVVLRRLNQAPRVFAMFLLGFYAARQGMFTRAGLQRGWYRPAFWWGLAIGLPLSAAVSQLPDLSPFGPVSFAAWLRVALDTVGAPALCICYISGLTWLFQSARGRRWLAPLMPMGRMALTNYLLQSVLCIAIFYGIGMGLFMQVSVTVSALIALGVLLIQARLSAWWLKRAAFGPAEWLWRQFTYGKRSELWRRA